MYKKFTLVFLSMMIMSSSTFSQITYGVKAGVTESFLHDKIGSFSENYNLRTGYQAGVFANVPINKNVSLRPSLQLTQKGFRKIEGTNGSSYYWNRNFWTSYLELPIDALYNFYLNERTTIQLGMGPVFGIGLFGENKTIITSGNSMQQTHMEYWVSNDAFNKRFDFGWDFLINLQYHRTSISASYNHGLTDLLDDGDHKAKNRSFALTVGYLLKSK
jgi:hypothetical protein